MKAAGVPGLVSERPSTFHTPEEQSHIETVVAFLGLPNSADRSAYVTDDYRNNRPGMQNLCELAGIPDAGPGPHVGYNEESFVDRRNEIVDVIASGTVVWVMFRLVGTHTGPFWGIPATGNPLDLYELGVFRLNGRLIAETWFMNDELAICRQLGIPVPVSDVSSE